MSPMALRRTTSRLFICGRVEGSKAIFVVVIRTASRLLCAWPRARNDFGGGVILWIADNDDTSSAGLDFIALWNALSGVVRALGMKVRSDFADDGAYVFLWKDYDRVYIGERRQNFSAFFGGHYRTALALQ